MLTLHGGAAAALLTSILLASVLDCKPFQFFWGVKLFLDLTKIIENNTKIYSTKEIYYESMFNEESNNTYLAF